MFHSIWFWIWFHLAALGMIFLDLKVFHKHRRKSSLRSITYACLFWVLLAFVFNVVVGWSLGMEAGYQFFTAYLLEKSLSVDNLFLFLVIFSFCQVSEKDQKRVLTFGILGALIFRLSFILLGISLLRQFEWLYVAFGLFLCISAVYFYRKEEGEEEIRKSLLVRFGQKIFPLDHAPHKGRFFIKKHGKIYVTMLFFSLFLIESSDILFAVDSIPAVLAITSDPLIAYTSNVFAILGLRSAYFLLAHIKEKVAYLKVAIAIILFFIGIKMILMPFWEVPIWATLVFITVVLLSSVALSPKKD